MRTSTKNSQNLMLGMVMVITTLVFTACASQTAGQPAAQTSGSNSGSNSASSVGGGTPVSAAAGQVSFSKDITPIFQASCISCHGGERTSRGLDLKTYTSLMAGSQNGAMIVPGNAGNSILIQSVSSGTMPKRGTRLTDVQIQLLVDWVNAGAKNN